MLLLNHLVVTSLHLVTHTCLSNFTADHATAILFTLAFLALPRAQSSKVLNVLVNCRSTAFPVAQMISLKGCSSSVCSSCIYFLFKPYTSLDMWVLLFLSTKKSILATQPSWVLFWWSWMLLLFAISSMMLCFKHWMCNYLWEFASQQKQIQICPSIEFYRLYSVQLLLPSTCLTFIQSLPFIEADKLIKILCTYLFTSVASCIPTSSLVIWNNVPHGQCRHVWWIAHQWYTS